LSRTTVWRRSNHRFFSLQAKSNHPLSSVQPCGI